jgi:hypothetical protein
MKHDDTSYDTNILIVLFGLAVVETCVAARQVGDAAHYARATRVYLDRAERAARKEARRGGRS